MLDQKLGLDEFDLKISTYQQADEHTKRAFRELVLGLTSEEDDENGPDTWNWVLENNDKFPVGGCFATFIFSDRYTGEVLATATFTPDDRGCLKDNHIEAFGMWAFVNVLRRDLRGQGLGTLVLEHLDHHVQRMVNQFGRTQDVYLFSKDLGVYAKYGFEKTGLTINYQGQQQPLCKKTYVARKSE